MLLNRLVERDLFLENVWLEQQPAPPTHVCEQERAHSQHTSKSILFAPAPPSLSPAAYDPVNILICSFHHCHISIGVHACVHQCYRASPARNVYACQQGKHLHLHPFKSAEAAK